MTRHMCAPTQADAMLMYPNTAKQSFDAVQMAGKARVFGVLFVFVSLLPAAASGTPETDGLDYLNSLRAAAGTTTTAPA